MTDSQDAYLGATVPHFWLQQYESLAQKKGKTREELIREALADYLSINSASDSQSSQLTQEITDLSRRVTVLETAQSHLNHLAAQFQHLEQKFKQLSGETSNRDNQPQNPPSSSNSEKINKTSPAANFSLVTPPDQEDYDEPDEILWDFKGDHS